MARMPNPSAVPIVDRSGMLTPEWVRWLQGLSATTDATTTTAPAPAPTPAPDPGPVTAALLSLLGQGVDGLQQLPSPAPDLSADALLGLQASDQAPQLAARLDDLERAVKDLRQGTAS